LLDVNAVDGDILNPNVFEKNVGDETGGIGVCLDAGAILGVEDN
jgi:hypothetical protein